MPGAVGAATSPGAKAGDDGKMADQLHLAVASALDAASSRLFGDYPDVERSLNVVEDDAISALSGFASAGHVSPFPTPLSHPPPVSPRPIPRKMSIVEVPDLTIESVFKKLEKVLVVSPVCITEDFLNALSACKTGSPSTKLKVCAVVLAL